jgi:hypothetical protein
MRVEGLDAAVVDYINEIKTSYENQIEYQEHQIHTLKNDVRETITSIWT